MNQISAALIRDLIHDNMDFTLPDSDDEDLHMDSMILLELVVILENKLGLEIQEAELENIGHFKNLETIASFVARTREKG